MLLCFQNGKQTEITNLSLYLFYSYSNKAVTFLEILNYSNRIAMTLQVSHNQMQLDLLKPNIIAQYRIFSQYD